MLSSAVSVVCNTLCALATPLAVEDVNIAADVILLFSKSSLTDQQQDLLHRCSSLEITLRRPWLV